MPAKFRAEIEAHDYQNAPCFTVNLNVPKWLYTYITSFAIHVRQSPSTGLYCAGFSYFENTPGGTIAHFHTVLDKETQKSAVFDYPTNAIHHAGKVALNVITGESIVDYAANGSSIEVFEAEQNPLQG